MLKFFTAQLCGENQLVIIINIANIITVKHEIFVAEYFCGLQIFIISLHIIFAESTIDNMGYLTAVKFCCM